MADDAIVDGAPAGAGTGGGTPGTQNAPGGGQQPVAPPVAEKSYSFREDRSDWIPRTRLNDQSSKHQKEVGELRARLDDQERRARTAFGIDTPSREETEAAEIREALEAMYPGLKNLDKFDVEELEELREAAKSTKSDILRRWERHAETMVVDLEADVAEGIGMDKLSPTQTRRLRSAYREEAQGSFIERQRAMQRGERDTLETIRTDNDFLARHERGDKTLIADFSKAFLDDWFEPARRSAASAQQRRLSRPVPRGERTRVSTTTKQPDIDYNDPKAFKQALAEARAGR